MVTQRVRTGCVRNVIAGGGAVYYPLRSKLRGKIFYENPPPRFTLVLSVDDGYFLGNMDPDVWRGSDKAFWKFSINLSPRILSMFNCVLSMP